MTVEDHGIVISNLVPLGIVPRTLEAALHQAAALERYYCTAAAVGVSQRRAKDILVADIAKAAGTYDRFEDSLERSRVAVIKESLGEE